MERLASSYLSESSSRQSFVYSRITHNRRRFLPFAAMSAGGLLIAYVADTRPISEPTQNEVISIGALENDLFALTNRVRDDAGCDELLSEDVLIDTARQRSQDMARNNYFGHTSPAGETAFTILATKHHSYAIAGENIARNNSPDSQTSIVAYNGFMHSPGHRGNILNSRFKFLGIGHAKSKDGMHYFTQIFAS